MPNPTMEDGSLRLPCTPVVGLLCLVLASDGEAQVPRLVDVGGHRLEASVAGHGRPVVVLEAGHGQERRHWTAIQDSVSQFTTVVAYSRAGYATSESSPRARTPTQVVAELRSLLTALELEGPFVVVGHSLGAIYARVFARQFTDETAGLVLVDGAHEQGMMRCNELSPSATFGQDLRRQFEEGSRQAGPGAFGELEELLKIWRRGTLPEAEPLPNLPMVVLTSYKPDPRWMCGSEAVVRIYRALHAEQFAQSTLAAHVVTSESGHMIHDDAPGLLVNSIRQVLRWAQAPGSRE